MLDLKVVAQDLLGVDVNEAEKDGVNVVNEMQALLYKYSDIVKAKYPNKGAVITKLAEVLAKQIPDEKFVSILVGKLPGWLQWLSFVISPLVLKAKAIIIREIIQAVSDSISK